MRTWARETNKYECTRQEAWLTMSWAAAIGNLAYGGPV